MFAYISRRLVLAVPVVIGILFATFALARMIPGDPCRAALGEKATDVICDAFIKRFGLDRPIPTQFGIYMKDVVQGDLGDSIRFGRPATELIAERLRPGADKAQIDERIWDLFGEEWAVRTVFLGRIGPARSVKGRSLRLPLGRLIVETAPDCL